MLATRLVLNYVTPVISTIERSNNTDGFPEGPLALKLLYIARHAEEKYTNGKQGKNQGEPISMFLHFPCPSVKSRQRPSLARPLEENLSVHAEFSSRCEGVVMTQRRRSRASPSGHKKRCRALLRCRVRRAASNVE